MSFCQKCDSLSQKTRNHRSIALAGHGRFQIGYCAGLVRSVSQCQFSGLSESGIIVQPQDFLRCCLFRSHWMLGMSDSDGNTMPRRYFTWGSLHEYLPLCGVIENYVFWMILSSTNRLHPTNIHNLGYIIVKKHTISGIYSCNLRIDPTTKIMF